MLTSALDHRRIAHTPKGASTRTQLFECARRVLIEEGLDALAMRDLAQRCQVKLGNLQYYYPTRDALLIAIIEAEAQLDRDAIRVAMTAQLSHEAMLQELVLALARRWHGDAGAIYAALTYLSLHCAEFRALRKRVYLAFYAGLVELLRKFNPRASAERLNERAQLLTMLLDGAPMQMPCRRPPALIDAVVREALRIAKG